MINLSIWPYSADYKVKPLTITDNRIVFITRGWTIHTKLNRKSRSRLPLFKTSASAAFRTLDAMQPSTSFFQGKRVSQQSIYKYYRPIYSLKRMFKFISTIFSYIVQCFHYLNNKSYSYLKNGMNKKMNIRMNSK